MSNLFALVGLEDDFDPTEYHGGVPEFIQKNNDADYTIIVRIRSDEDLDKFAELLGQPNLKARDRKSTKSTWWPALARGERGSNCLHMWIDGDDEEKDQE